MKHPSMLEVIGPKESSERALARAYWVWQLFAAGMEWRLSQLHSVDTAEEAAELMARAAFESRLAKLLDGQHNFVFDHVLDELKQTRPILAKEGLKLYLARITKAGEPSGSVAQQR